MTLVQRVQDLLMKPKSTWPVIASEGGDVASVFRSYLVFLAAIPAVAGFIGWSLVGLGGVRVPIVSGLVNAVIGYVMSLLMVFLLALIVDALAPTFGGTKNQINAVKLVGYGMTASFVGGVFMLIPALGALGLLAALYSIYLIYLGLPVLIKCPDDKAIAYTAVTVVCGIVLAIVVSSIASIGVPAPVIAVGV
jgi:hypothetical protein